MASLVCPNTACQRGAHSHHIGIDPVVSAYRTYRQEGTRHHTQLCANTEHIRGTGGNAYCVCVYDTPDGIQCTIGLFAQDGAQPLLECSGGAELLGGVHSFIFFIGIASYILLYFPFSCLPVPPSIICTHSFCHVAGMPGRMDYFAVHDVRAHAACTM